MGNEFIGTKSNHTMIQLLNHGLVQMIVQVYIYIPKNHLNFTIWMGNEFVGTKSNHPMIQLLNHGLVRMIVQVYIYLKKCYTTSEMCDLME